MTAKREEVIDSVRNAEARSAERIENARKKAEEMKNAAVREAMAIKASGERGAREAYQKIIDAKKMEIEEKRKAILSMGEGEAREIRSHGASNLPKALDILLSKLESED